MHIDTLSLSGKTDDLPVHDERFTKRKILSGQENVSFVSNDVEYDVDQFLHQYFKIVFGCDLDATPIKKNGFQRVFNIMHPKYKIPLGHVGLGGDAMRGSYQIYINGVGCEALAELFHKIYTMAESFKMTVTRCDIAQDFFTGRFNVAYAKKQYESGGFKGAHTRGAKPTAKYFDDMGSGAGKTLYVGKLASSGREVCVYEKGKQLKSEKYPDWVRWELRLGKRNRVIPLDVLLHFQSYFVAELPILGRICKGLDLLTHAVSAMTAKKQKALGDIAHLITYATLGYGRLLNVLQAIGASPDDIVKRLTVSGAPARMKDTDLGKITTSGFSDRSLKEKLSIWMNDEYQVLI